MFLAQVQQVITDSSTALRDKSELFLKIDPFGIGMAVIGYVVIFLALLLLYLVFSNLTRLINLRIKKELKKEGTIEKDKKDISISGEVNAAIALAIHLYLKDIHDEESAILTINRVSRTYSPWSSKIYGLRQNPR